MAKKKNNEAALKATVEKGGWDNLSFSFGRTQGEMWLSARGKIAREMKFEDGEKVAITIRRLV